MRLLDQLYHITASEQHGDEATYHIALHADHVIYQAHFPGQPITPGVVILQVAEELASEMLGREVSLRAVKNVKYLAVLSPVETPEVTFLLKIKSQEEDRTALQATVCDGDQPLAKISCTVVYQP